MADDRAEIEIIATLRDEASAALAILRANVGEFEKAAAKAVSAGPAVSPATLESQNRLLISQVGAFKLGAEAAIQVAKAGELIEATFKRIGPLTQTTFISLEGGANGAQVAMRKLVDEVERLGTLAPQAGQVAVDATVAARRAAEEASAAIRPAPASFASGVAAGFSPQESAQFFEQQIASVRARADAIAAASEVARTAVAAESAELVESADAVAKARAQIAEYIATLAQQAQAVQVSADEARRLGIVRAAEQAAAAAGTQLLEEERQAILAQVDAVEALEKSRAQAAAAVRVDAYLEGLEQERELMSLSDAERKEYLAQLRVEEIAKQTGAKATDEQIAAVLREVQAIQALAGARQTAAVAAEQQARATGAAGKISDIIAGLERQREALTLTADERQRLAVIEQAERAASAGGITLRAEQLDLINQEVTALQSLQAQIRAQAEAEALATREQERRVQVQQRESGEREKAQADLNEFVQSIEQERALIKLNANEREIAVARRRAESLAIKAGITDRETIIRQIDREVTALQRERQARGVSLPQLSGLTSILGSGGGLSTITSQAQQSATAFQQLAQQAGLSGTALVAVGATAAGIAAVGAGLALAAREAAQLSESLKPAIVLSADAVKNFSALRDAAIELSNLTARPNEEAGAAIAAAYSAGARTAQDAIALARAAADASVLGFGTMEQAVGRLDSVLDSYRLKATDAQSVTEKLFVAAREGEVPAGAFADALTQTAQAANEMQISIDETAAVLASMTRNGITASQAANGLNQILLKLGNPRDAARQRIEGLGVDLSRQAIEAKGLIGVFRELSALRDANPDLIQDLFGSKRTSDAAFAGLRDGGREALDTLTKMQAAATEAGAALERGLNDPSSKLSRTYQTIKNNLDVIGRQLLAIGAIGFGTDATPRVQIEPADFVSARQELVDAVTKGDDAAIARATANVQALIDAARAKLRVRPQDIEAQVAAVPAGIDPKALGIVDQDAALQRLREFVAAAKSGLDGLGVSSADFGKAGGLLGLIIGDVPDSATARLDAVQSAAVATSDALKILNDTAAVLGRGAFERGADGQVARVTVDAELTPKISAPDKFQLELQKLLRDLPQTTFALTPVVLPEDIEAARKTVEKFSASRGDALSSIEKTELDAATTKLKEFGDAQRQLDEIGRAARQKTVEGFGAQRDAIEEARQKTLEHVETLGKDREQVDLYREAVNAAADAEQRRVNLAEAQRTGAGDIAQLQALAQEAAARAELARAKGNDRAEEQAAFEARTLGFQQERQQIELNLAAQVAAAAGDELAIQKAEALAASLEKQVTAREQTADLAARQIITERRDRGNAQEADLRDGLLEGLDAEFAAIERNANAGRARAVADQIAGQITASSLARQLILFGELEAKQKELAQRAATDFVSDNVLAAQRALATTEAELLAIDIKALEVEKQRTIEALTRSKASAEEVATVTAEFDQRKFEREALARVQQLFGEGASIDIALVPQFVFEQNVREGEIQRRINDLISAAQRDLAKLTIGVDDEKALARLRQLSIEVEKVRKQFEASFGTAFLEESARLSLEFGSDAAAGAKLANDAFQAFGDNTADALTAFQNSLANGKFALGDFAAAFARDIQSSINQILAFKAASALFNLFTPGLAGASAAGGTASNVFGLPIASAKGNVFSGGNFVPITPHAFGGVPSLGDLPKLGNSPALFQMPNGGLGSIREKGIDEAILPLERRGGVLGVRASIERTRIDTGGGERQRGGERPIEFHVHVTHAPTFYAPDQPTFREQLARESEVVVAQVTHALHRQTRGSGGLKGEIQRAVRG